ncbi:MAG TPA: NAD-dependent epimerase/dehydratase family protein [Armatimonadota bacterium]|jgi:nucleoside-diphosphate-sugar epimerase
MRVLVIGGTRFMGPRVIARILGAGHEVTAFHRGPSTHTVPEAARHIFGNRHDLPNHAVAIRGVQPDVVLDMMLITERNAVDLLDVLQGVDCRIVAASSCDVYASYGRLLRIESGEPDPNPLTEDSPLRQRLYPYRGDAPLAEDDPKRPMDDYDKILVERALQAQAEHPWTILRLPMVYGPDDYQRRLKPYLSRMDAGVTEIAIPSSEAAFSAARGYVENAAAAIALAVLDQRACNRVYNVADEPTLDEASWVRSIGAAAGWTGKVSIVPDTERPAEDTSDYRHHLDIDATRIRRELDYTEPVTLAEALTQTIEWERGQA